MKSFLNKLRLSRHRALIYILCYTALFCACAAGVFCWFALRGKSLIWVGPSGDLDGISQHYIALGYYGSYLRGIVRNLFATGHLSVPMIDLSIGMGQDVVSTLSYYVIGDPLTLTAFFVPREYTEYLYNFLILFRLYLAGLSFSLFAGHIKRNNRYFTLISSMIYVFCAYSLFAMRHPYFLNPLIYLPLILLGAEHIFENKKPWLFISAITLSAMSNFYFFYMLCVLTVIYAVVRIFDYLPQKTWGAVWHYVWRFALFALLGIMMAGILFYPSIRTILASARQAEAGPSTPLLYTLHFYKQYLFGMVATTSAGFWTYNGLAPLSLIAVLLMWLSPRKNRTQIVLFCIGTVMLTVPIFGWLLNGTAYVSNRWCWGYALLVSCICALNFDRFFTLTARKWCVVIAFAVCYVGLGLLLRLNMTFVICITLVLLSAVIPFIISKCIRRPAARQVVMRVALLLLVVVQVITFGALRYRVADYSAVFENSGAAYDFVYNAQGRPLNNLNDTEFYRYEDYDHDMPLIRNAPLLNGGHSTSSYFSLSSETWYSLLSSVGHNDVLPQIVFGLDARAVIGALSNVKYYTTPTAQSSATLPYGYSKTPVFTADLPNYNLNMPTFESADLPDITFGYYKNNNALPFGYTYDSYFTREQYDKLSFTQKQNMLLHGAVLNEKSDILPSAQIPDDTDTEIPFTVTIDENSKDIVQNGNTFTTYNNGQIVYLTLKGAASNKETYINLYGGTYHQDDPVTRAKAQGKWEELSTQKQAKLTSAAAKHSEPNSAVLRFGINGNNKNLHLYSEHYSYYPGVRDYSVNLGAFDTAPTTVRLRFPSPGVYSFDKIEVVQLGLPDFEEQIGKIGAEHLENVEFADNLVSGDITVSDAKLMCLSLPYSAGWRAFVDGGEVEIKQTDLAFMGIELDAGSHHIEFRYFSPYLKFGALLSTAGWLIFVAWVATDFVIRKKKKQKEQS